MDYQNYYAQAHPQSFPLFGVQQAHDSQSNQFQNNPQHQQQYDSTFHAFENNYPFGLGAEAPQPASHPEPFSLKHDCETDINGANTFNGTYDELAADQNAANAGRSSSEEKEILTPAQSRRKEQNRAAQRAFRERKERRVRELEEELDKYKQNVLKLSEDNEGLKREIAKVSTENEILRATCKNSSSSPSTRADSRNRNAESPTVTGPMRYTPLDCNGKDPAHRVVVSEKTGGKLLNASETWDLIVSNASEEGVKVDVQDVYERLKEHVQCDGTGPAMDEGIVRRAIRESIRGGSDELI